ncbi:MaoC family dehydratase [Paradesulfitobacterium aromaticivorans]
MPSNLQLRQYAEASGDFNPVHLDDSYAQKAGFKGVITHGMLIMTQLGALLTDWIGNEGSLKSFNVRFKNPVYVCEKIVCTGFIRDKVSNGVICNLLVTKSTGEETLVGQAVVEFSLN